MWMIGGGTASSSYFNDVWYSSDGVNWTQATANAGLSARYWHTSVVFNSKMWVIGGFDDRGLMYGLLDVADRIGWAAIRGTA